MPLPRPVELLAKYPREFAITLLALGMSIAVDGFFQTGNLRNLLVQGAPLLLLATGQAAVLLTGGIDLSQGAATGLFSVTLVAISPRLGIAGAILGTLSAAIALGALNGLLVTRLRLNPLIATMAVMYMLGGIAMFWTGGSPLNQLPGDTTAFFEALSSGALAGAPAAFIVATALLCGMWVVLERTVLGLYIFAVGSNPTAARVHGLPSSSAIIAAYILSALATASAATLLSARILQGNPHLGEGLLFDSIGGAVLGGVALSGGVGGVWPAARGVLLLLLIQNALYLSDLDSNLRDVFVGLLIILGVVLGNRRGRTT